ncbi:hypothetical protein ACFVT5_11115 [Streptomyces sp. NPDC058001]|uniref:hypothetical protein n=1 Tax=Streptomyces sp. NPDC058001 TaxID=3346300 RepID=UPI0036EBD594
MPSGSCAPHDSVSRPAEPAPPADDPPLLSDRLTAWVHGRPSCERAAVAALIEEDELLARDCVHRLLVAEHDGAVSCDWPEFENRYTLAPGLTSADKAFLALILAIRFPRAVPLWPVELLDDRRLGIVLRAIVALAGSDTIAVGTRS